MAIRVKFDLDLEDLKDVYADAKDTIKYLEDVVKSIEKRVIEDGEEVEGLEVVEGSSKRVITKDGISYLLTLFPEDKIYEKKAIGITKLEKMLSEKDICYLVEKGYVVFEKGKNKINIKETE